MSDPVIPAIPHDTSERTGALRRWADSFRLFPSKEACAGSQPYVASTAGARPQEHLRSGELAAYIGAGTRFEGDLHYAGGAAHIDGEVLGSVDAEKASQISLGPRATIHGTIVAPHVIVHGHVRGDIVASSSVIVRRGAYVLGDIYCRHVAVEAGGIVVGRLRQNGEQPPSAADTEAPLDESVSAVSAELVDVVDIAVKPVSHADVEVGKATQTVTQSCNGEIGAYASDRQGQDSTQKSDVEPPALHAAAVRLFLKKLF